MIGVDPRATGGPGGDAPGTPVHARDAGPLVNRDASFGADASETPDELGRIQDDVPAGRSVETGLPQRRVDLGLDLLPVHELVRLAVFGRLVDPFAEAIDLMRLVRHR